jgi:lipoprotein-anchoring transpeptidase ErfK/SrfK
MKRIVSIATVFAAGLSLAAGLALGAAAVSADSAPQPEKLVIVGTVVDVATYAMEGSTAEEHTDAFKNRAELGFPVAIVDDETGEVYIAVYRTPAPASPLETANEVLLPLMGKKVAAQGIVFKTRGVNLIRLSVVSEY